MKLNSMKPAEGSKRGKLRVGRGASAGQGKTCGRGVKGQRARKGGYHKVGFEGGQIQLFRRLPKVGFRSALNRTRSEITLETLTKIAAANNGVVDLAAVKAASAVPANIEKVKVVLSGEVGGKVLVRGLAVTKGARAAIEAAGGTIEGAPAAAGDAPPATKAKSEKAGKAGKSAK
jgi:large subunit ribosomal protein L15